MMIKQGDTVYALEAAGSIVEGIFTGEKSEGMFGISVGVDKTIFKRSNNIFPDKLMAQARKIVSRYKRLSALGVPMADIVFTEEDRPALELATELWPEDMV